MTLPAGWRLSTIAQEGRVDLGRQRHPNWHTGPEMRPYLRVANVFEDRIDASDIMEMDFSRVFERFRLEPGDVLLNEGQTPDKLGRPAIYRGVPENAAFTNSLIRFRAGPNVLPEWALLVFRHHMHSGRFRRESRITTNIAHLSATRFKAVEFPIPPLKEQCRIVEVLEDHLSRVDAGARNLVSARARFESLRRSTVMGTVMNAAAAHGTTTLGQIADVGTGSTPSRANRGYFDGGNIPWVTSGDLAVGLIAEASRHVTKQGAAAARLRTYPPGTLLLAMYGEGKTRGTVAELAIPATINQACAAIFLKDQTLVPWVRLALEANYSKMRQMASGGVQPNLNLRLVRSIEVPIPPAEERDCAVRRHRALTDNGHRLVSAVRRLEDRAAALQQSLLSAAFSGRLCIADLGLSVVPD